MPAAPITPVTVPRDNVGYDLTNSADFTTLVAGADEGVTWPLDVGQTLVLKNATGGAAAFTLKFRTTAGVAQYGGSVVDGVATVVDQTTVLLKLSDIQKQSDGNAIVECDVAGEALVLN